jgi:hypothetical protein
MLTRIMAGTAVVAAALAFAPTADASTQAAPDCQYGKTYGYRVDHQPILNDDNVSVGEVQLCRDSDYQYWGFVLFSHALTVSEYGDVVLERDHDGAYPGFVDCDSPGGNKTVMPGQTRCWTPKLDGRSGHYTFLAEGSLTSSHTGATIAFGYTVVPR